MTKNSLNSIRLGPASNRLHEEGMRTWSPSYLKSISIYMFFCQTRRKGSSFFQKELLYNCKKSIDVRQLKTLKNKTKNNNKWRPNPPTPIPSCLTGYEGGDKKTKISKLGMVQKCLLGSRLVPSYAVTIPNEELL